MNCDGILLGTELLNILESCSSEKSSPETASHKMTLPSENRPPTVNNIIINNYKINDNCLKGPMFTYNGGALKNITNLEPYASRNDYKNTNNMQ